MVFSNEGTKVTYRKEKPIQAEKEERHKRKRRGHGEGERERESTICAITTDSKERRLVRMGLLLLDYARGSQLLLDFLCA